MAGLHTLEEYIQCSGSIWTLAREFIWGDRFPEPVAMVTHGGTSGGFGGSSVPAGTAVYYYLRDVLGSVIGLTDSNGTLVERYSYDPYGKTFIETWNPTTQTWSTALASPLGNPFFWTGQRYDATTAEYQFLYRSYSPTLGRWLHQDPLGYVDGVNLFEYVRASPLEFVDVFGTDTVGGANLRDPANNEKETRGFRAAASDCDHVVNVVDLDDFLRKLKIPKKFGVPIDRLYVIMHGNSWRQSMYKYPDEHKDGNIDPRDPRWREIWELIEPDGEIVLCGCSTGADPDVVQEYADGAQRRVRAPEGPMNINDILGGNETTHMGTEGKWTEKKPGQPTSNPKAPAGPEKGKKDEVVGPPLPPPPKGKK